MLPESFAVSVAGPRGKGSWSACRSSSTSKVESTGLSPLLLGRNSAHCYQCETACAVPVATPSRGVLVRLGGTQAEPVCVDV